MTVSELQTRILDRLGDDPSTTADLMHYTPQEVLVALNQCQRMFVLFTLCLEATTTCQLTGVAFYSLLSSIADWLAPLRFRNAGGVKMRPARLSDLAALDASWSGQSGTPERYSLSGFDLLGVYKQNSSILTVTYARCPVDLTSTSQTPEIPVRYHPALIDGAIPLLRVKEGMQEWQKTLPMWDRWLGAIAECAERVRARNKEQGYDTYPVELKRFDRSRVLQKAG